MALQRAAWARLVLNAVLLCLLKENCVHASVEQASDVPLAASIVRVNHGHSKSTGVLIAPRLVAFLSQNRISKRPTVSFGGTQTRTIRAAKVLYRSSVSKHSSHSVFLHLDAPAPVCAVPIRVHRDYDFVNRPAFLAHVPQSLPSDLHYVHRVHVPDHPISLHCVTPPHVNFLQPSSSRSPVFHCTTLKPTECRTW